MAAGYRRGKKKEGGGGWSTHDGWMLQECGDAKGLLDKIGLLV